MRLLDLLSCECVMFGPYDTMILRGEGVLLDLDIVHIPQTIP
jgi:hypothetical protein